MTIIACPKCKDEVRVPARAAASAVVRCPLCSEEYRLGDALEQLPPELIVVSGMEEETSADPYASPAGGFGDAGDYQMAPAAGVSAGVFDTTGPGEGAAVARPALRGTARPKRKEKSMVGEVVKIVLGGVVGVSLAIPIIWWFGKTDPFQLGPTISPFAPWAVPAQFHAKKKSPSTTASVDTSGGDLAGSNAVPQPAPPPKGLQTLEDLPLAGGQGGALDPSGFGAASGSDSQAGSLDPLAGGLNPVPFAPVEPSLEPANPLAPPTPAAPADPLALEDPLGLEKSQPSAEPTLEDPLAALSPTTPQPAKPKAKPKRTKSAPPPMPDLADLMPDSAAPAEPAKPEEKPDTKPKVSLDPQPEPAPQPAIVTAADLETSLKTATTARDAFNQANADAADAETRKRLGAEMFDAIAATGTITTQLSVEDADNAAAIASLHDLLAAFKDDRQRRILAFFAGKRLAEEPMAEGILLSGTVKDFKSVGGAFETVVELTGTTRTVPVLTFKNPQDVCKIDDPVLVVGRIVRDPKVNLKGYEGEQPLLVTAGYTVVVKP